MAERRLVTLAISHYCEKARWALERAGLAYAEERHIQLVHAFAARRAGGGSTVPVLVTPHGVIASSEAILHYADAHVTPGRRLFTGDPEVTTLARGFDAGLGPDSRRLVYALMLPVPRLALRFNNAGVPGWEALALRALYPLASRMVARLLDVGPTTLADDVPRVRAAFDTVAERLADGRPYLCGERFSAADLTFAALAAAVVLPPRYGVPLPQPDVLPAAAARLVGDFRAHPAGAFALRLFATERG